MCFFLVFFGIYGEIYVNHLFLLAKQKKNKNYNYQKLQQYFSSPNEYYLKIKFIDLLLSLNKNLSKKQKESFFKNQYNFRNPINRCEEILEKVDKEYCLIRIMKILRKLFMIQ